MSEEKKYIGTYKVIRFFKISRKRNVLERGLTREEAIELVDSYPERENSFVGFEKQFTADKYYQKI